MTDKELLKLASKAAGINLIGEMMSGQMDWPYRWNPMIDDGDALRLAIKLGLLIDCDNVLNEVEAVLVMHGADDDYVRMNEQYSDDRYAATRRAIVRAAAEIGKGMK